MLENADVLRAAHHITSNVGKAVVLARVSDPIEPALEVLIPILSPHVAELAEREGWDVERFDRLGFRRLVAAAVSEYFVMPACPACHGHGATWGGVGYRGGRGLLRAQQRTPTADFVECARCRGSGRLTRFDHLRARELRQETLEEHQAQAWDGVMRLLREIEEAAHTEMRGALG